MAELRSHIQDLTALPNVGARTAEVLVQLGIARPQDLIGRDPVAMYREFCRLSGERQDPCVADVFIAVVRYMEGDEPKPWWTYTAERKRDHPWIASKTWFETSSA
jgi:hypothetical protein